jgi:hypothetical protein
MKLLCASLFLAGFLPVFQDPGQDMPGQSEPGNPGMGPDVPPPVPRPIRIRPPAADPGVALLAHDGFLFVVKGNRIYKIDPKTLKVVAKSELEPEVEVEMGESHPVPAPQPVPMPPARR